MYLGREREDTEASLDSTDELKSQHDVITSSLCRPSAGWKEQFDYSFSLKKKKEKKKEKKKKERQRTNAYHFPTPPNPSHKTTTTY